MKGSLTLTACLLLTLCSFAGTVDTISVFSNSMKKPVKAVVIRPSNYKKMAAMPVVYLLHGWSGNYAQWIQASPQLPRLADEMQMMFVCPDGGYDSWYFDAPLDSAVRYESFIAKELVPYIDKNYKTRNSRTFRAIAGLSMGGHGAFYIGIRNKDLFGSAGSMAGAMDIRQFPNGWDLKKRLGDTTCCKANWEAHTVINVADQLKNGDMNLIIDCGVSDFFIKVNRLMHEKLLEKKIDHVYTERPGGHNKEYWGNTVDYELLFFKKLFDKAAATKP